MKKLSTSFISLCLIASTTVGMSFNLLAAAQKAKAPPVCPGSLIDGKKRKNYLASPKVGKKIDEAWQLIDAEDLDGALASFNELEADIDDDKTFDKITVWRLIGILHAQKNNLKESLKYLEKALKPNMFSARMQAATLKTYADLQTQEKFYKEAIQSYRDWMVLTCDEDPKIWQNIAIAYLELKQYDNVISPADKAIKAYGEKLNNVPYIVKLAAYNEQKNLDKAIEVLEVVVQLFPSDKRWWSQLGMYYVEVEKLDKGLTTLELAYKQGFLDKAYQIRVLANLYQQSGVPYKAAKLLEKHIASGLLDRDDKMLISLANAWHSSMEVDKAAKIYGEVAALTNEAKYYSKQGSLLIEAEKFKEGISALTKAIDLGAKNTGQLYMSIGVAHYYLEQFKSANKAIKESMKDPKTRKFAKNWERTIKDAAQRKGKSI